MKVIVSLTTHPGRNGKVQPCIDSLLAQSYKPDEIRLYYGFGCKDLPSGCTLIRSADHGPLTKLSAALDDTLAPDDLIVTADDDTRYKVAWLATLVAGAQKYPHNAVGFHGGDVDEILATKGARGWFDWKPGERPVDVLEGFCGVAYRRGFFTPDLMDIPLAVRRMDDVWISYYLKCKGVVRTRLAPSPTPGTPTNLVAPDHHTLGLHHHPQWQPATRKAVLLTFGGQAAVQPLEATFTAQYGQSSGHGSTPEYTEPYRKWLEAFCKDNKIQSVIDMPCGDMRVGGAVKWPKGCEYLGADIIGERIKDNRANFPKLDFVHVDMQDWTPPPADLLIVKDCLQHWSNADIARWLQALKGATFRFALLINCAYGPTLNSDTPTGGWRSLDMSLAPFGVGEGVFEWGPDDHHKKVVLLRGEDWHKGRTFAAKPVPPSPPCVGTAAGFWHAFFAQQRQRA